MNMIDVNIIILNSQFKLIMKKNVFFTIQVVFILTSPLGHPHLCFAF